jgi:predicted TIM-barrel fold metal-dependent hydrolase
MGLREEINSIPIIDGHVHAVNPWYWTPAVDEYPFLDMLGKLPEPNAYSTIYRRNLLLKCYQEEYDFKYGDINPETLAELDKTYQASRSDEATYAMKAMDKAGIEKALQVGERPGMPPGLDPSRFAFAQLVDGFLIPLDNSGIGDTLRAQRFVKMTTYWPNILRAELNPESLDDYLNMVSVALTRIADSGAAALKMNFAYWRDVSFEEVSKDEAEDVWNKKDSTPRRYKVLQDYIMRHLMAKAATLGLPTHMHMGSTSITKPMQEASPARFDPFLWLPDVKPAKIVMLHGAYPYCREAGFMVGRTADAPDLYLDISHIIYYFPSSMEIMVGQIREWILMGIVERLIYGSDSPSPMGILMAAINVREILCRVFQKFVDEGTFSEKQAVDMATLILRNNAKKLYSGKL